MYNNLLVYSVMYYIVKYLFKISNLGSQRCNLRCPTGKNLNLIPGCPKVFKHCKPLSKILKVRVSTIFMDTNSPRAEYWDYLRPVYRETVADAFGMKVDDKKYPGQRHRFLQQMSYVGLKSFKSVIYPAVALRGNSAESVISRNITVYVPAYGHEITRSFHIALGGQQKMMNPVCDAGTVFNTGITLFDRALDSSECAGSLKTLVTYDYLLEIIAEKQERKKDVVSDNPLVQIVVALVNEYFIRCHELLEMSSRTSVWEEHTRSLLALFLNALKGVTYSFVNHVPTQKTYTFVLERALAFSKILALDCLLSPDTDADLVCSEVFDPLLDLGKVFVILDDIRDLPDDIERGLWSYVSVKAQLDYGVQVLENAQKKEDKKLLREILSTRAVLKSMEDVFMYYTRAFDHLQKFIPLQRVYPLQNFIKKILTYSLNLKEESHGQGQH